LISPVSFPPPAGPGDRVGVAALSGPVDPERLECGLAELRRLGFAPVLADNLASRAGLFAGTDADRLAAFHRLAADPDLPAIFFARGGHGLLRILPGIDWELLARRPRAYVGYSDLTPFLLAVVARLRLAAFHGPMVAGDLARGLTLPEEGELLAALAGRYPREIPLAPPLRPGSARGPLLGGCLSLLAATLGTPYFPDLAGALLFFEDVNEPAYRLDRLLTHLSLSGNLEAIVGMLIGHLDGPDSPDSPGLPAGRLGRAGRSSGAELAPAVGSRGAARGRPAAIDRGRGVRLP
jgi:muramoyltetrapeptide carboxypeptidase